MLTPQKGLSKGCPHGQTMAVLRVLQESADALRSRGGKVVHTRWTGVEHALAAINNACCSNKLNIDVLHANGGMVSRSIVSAPIIFLPEPKRFPLFLE